MAAQMRVAMADRPRDCPICLKKIKKGQKYAPLVRFKRTGEGGGFHGGRINEDVHEECSSQWNDYIRSGYVRINR